jgi:probable rRNA maturation factor
VPTKRRAKGRLPGKDPARGNPPRSNPPRGRPPRRDSSGTGPGGIVATGPLTGIPGAGRLRGDLLRLSAHAKRLFGGPVEVTVSVMSDAEARRVNRRWLSHDYAPDVVSFPLSEPGAGVLVGTLAVSRDTARREARRRGHAPYHELMLYVVHGVLHLLGHDDGTARARAAMRRAEREALAALGLPAVYEPPGRGPRGTEGA